MEVETIVIEKPKKQTAAKKKKDEGSTPAKKTGKKTPAPRQSAIQVVKSFMEQQAVVNRSILDQLAQLKDKCDYVSSGGTEGESNKGISGRSVVNTKRSKDAAAEVHVLSESDDSDESEVDSELEARIDSEIQDAQSQLKAKFTKNSGRPRTAKQIEKQVNQQRPYAYLGREKQRDLDRQGVHPEELDVLSHVEGLTAMAVDIASDPRVKGILVHIHQTIQDCQVHNWPRVRSWSNKVLFKIASDSWEWDSASEIMQERNSMYVVPYTASDTEHTYPCYAYNKGECKHEASHFSGGTNLAHICIFCFSLDGSREAHISRSCNRRRSSSNYFRSRDDRDQNDKKQKFRFKGNGRENDEKQAKN